MNLTKNIADQGTYQAEIGMFRLPALQQVKETRGSRQHFECDPAIATVSEDGKIFVE